MSMTVQERAAAAVRSAEPRLLELSHAIHGFAELAFEEHRSAAVLCEELRGAGFSVETGVAGLPTAFVGTYGTGDFTVGVCLEYDALPGIGHACGHNIIATAGLGAVLGLAEVADELGLTVKAIGTPAEEHGGGKVLMLEAGAFDDLTVSLMIHPGPLDAHPAVSGSQGVCRYSATFTGRAAHAAAAPTQGVNAGDAAVVAQVALGLLRQQLPATARIASFVREGGEATNIIPARTVVDFEVREFDIAELRTLDERVRRCFEAGALATGCELVIEETEPEYAPLVHDPRLAEAYARAAEACGRELAGEKGLSGGSTDMGNVSQHLPALHPIVAVRGTEHPPHTEGFAADALSPAADEAVRDGALSMAVAVIAVAADAEQRAALLAEQAERPGYAARMAERHGGSAQDAAVRA